MRWINLCLRMRGKIYHRFRRIFKIMRLPQTLLLRDMYVAGFARDTFGENII